MSDEATTLDISDVGTEQPVDETPQEEAPVEEEESSEEEEAPVEEEAPQGAPVEEEAPVEEAPQEAPVEEEEAPQEAPVEEAPQGVPSTQEVVQNVQEILTTEPAVSSDSVSLEERVKVLEERLETLINMFSKSSTAFLLSGVRALPGVSEEWRRTLDKI
jgi:hypothetical protein